MGYDHYDITSWTFGDASVTEDRNVLLDAAHPERRLTKGDARSTIKRLARGLRGLNDGSSLQGDVVCIHSCNDIYYPVLFHGIIGSGGVFTGTNPAYTAEELAHHLRISKSRFVFTEPEYHERILEACALVNIPRSNVFILNFFDQVLPGGLRCWTSLLSDGEEEWEKLSSAEASRTTIAALCSTSGTTGLPKMAVRSHESLITEAEAIVEGQQGKPFEQIRLVTVPVFHAFASPLVNVGALRSGTPTYIMRRYAEEAFLSSIQRYGITETAMVPPIIIRCLSLSSEKQSCLKNLQTIWCGGAPIDQETQSRALQLFAKGARITQVWGMTECGWISTFPYPEADLTGSVGRPLRHFDVKLVDDGEHEVQDPAERGEIWVKGPSVMSGYHGNEKATKETMNREGWLRTGDIACLKEGKVYIVDRKKELIKVRGWQVAPAELEGTLLTHPAIADAGVIGIQHEGRDTEIPRAFIVCRHGASVKASDVKAYLLQHLAKYKVVDCEIRFRKEIPKSPSGKILRKLLREEVEEREPDVERAHFAEPPSTPRWSISPMMTDRRDIVLFAAIAVGALAVGVRNLRPLFYHGFLSVT